MYSVKVFFAYDVRENYGFMVEAGNKEDAVTKGLAYLEVDEIKDLLSIDVKQLTEQEIAEIKCSGCQKRGIKGKVVNGWVVCDSCYDLAKSWEPEVN